MWLLVDGDNSPGETRTIGADRLHPTKDQLIVFYGMKNPYYNSESNREKLKQQTTCPVQFMQIAQGSNSVDFAMAIFAGKICSDADKDGICLILVSGDKHLSTVERELTSIYDNCSIKCVQTIDEAICRYQLMESDTAEDIKTVLCNQYGDTAGQHLYFKLRDCFAAEHTTVPKALKQKAYTILKSIRAITDRKVG